jgi:hypothetical protein
MNVFCGFLFMQQNKFMPICERNSQLNKLTRTLSSMVYVKILQACMSLRFLAATLSAFTKVSVPSTISKKSHPQIMDWKFFPLNFSRLEKSLLLSNTK